MNNNYLRGYLEGYRNKEAGDKIKAFSEQKDKQIIPGLFDITRTKYKPEPPPLGGKLKFLFKNVWGNPSMEVKEGETFDIDPKAGAYLALAGLGGAVGADVGAAIGGTQGSFYGGLVGGLSGPGLLYLLKRLNALKAGSVNTSSVSGLLAAADFERALNNKNK